MSEPSHKTAQRVVAQWNALENDRFSSQQSPIQITLVTRANEG